MEEVEIRGERKESVCVGDPLYVLTDPSCEITDSKLLLEDVRKLAPDAFCLDWLIRITDCAYGTMKCRGLQPNLGCSNGPTSNMQSAKIEK